MKGSKQRKRLAVRKANAPAGKSYRQPGSMNSHKSQSIQTKTRQFRKRRTR
jgi:hypothetical protein